MPTTSVTIRMEEQLKSQVEILLNEMGLNMTTAITLFAKTIVREGRIPFEIRVDPFYNEKTMERLAKAVRDMDSLQKCTEHKVFEE